MKTEEIYCSLDIETTGFDPLKDEILEVGFVFFSVTKNGLIPGDEFTQVFKPSIKVNSKILGLTGISEKELESAPLFSEFKDEIQEKIKHAVIVGHNVGFDIKFLETAGITFSGKVIDTLDLVQWILPSHHSYNLENLMSYFGVSHKDAHRALADSKAALKVLEKLLTIYFGFSNDLKNQIFVFLKDRNFIWKNLIQNDFDFKQTSKKDKKTLKTIKSVRKPAKPKDSLKKKTLYRLGFEQESANGFFDFVVSTSKKIIVTFPNKQIALKKAKQYEAYLLIDEEDVFNLEKFKTFLSSENLSDDQVKFALKILVWQEQSNSSLNISELNLSFFGGQFKSVVCGKVLDFSKQNLVFTDHKNFLKLSEENKLDKRFAVVFGLPDFESSLTWKNGGRVSWGGVSYIVKSYLNSDIKGLNSEKVEEAINELVNASDLFFGLFMTMFYKQESGYLTIKISEGLSITEEFLKAKTASENFAKKITTANLIFKSEKLDLYVENLKRFFQEDKNTIRWVEMSEKSCTFQSAPIDIKPQILDIESKSLGLAFADVLPSESVEKYFITRFGLGKYAKKDMVFQQQLDLFTLKDKEVACYLDESLNKQLIKVTNKESLPAVLLMGSQLTVKEFYEKNYSDLKEFSFLLAQSTSGGVNKLINNFEIHENSLLLATEKMILKYITSDATASGKDTLEVKTLVLTKLPFELYSHPYQEALASQFENSFTEFSLPRALINFHRIFEFFNTSILRNLYITDPKIKSQYGSVFTEYLEKRNKIKFF